MSDELETLSAALTILAVLCLLASFEVAHRREAKAVERRLKQWRSIYWERRDR